MKISRNLKLILLLMLLPIAAGLLLACCLLRNMSHGKVDSFRIAIFREKWDDGLGVFVNEDGSLKLSAKSYPALRTQVQTGSTSGQR